MLQKLDPAFSLANIVSNNICHTHVEWFNLKRNLKMLCALARLIPQHNFHLISEASDNMKKAGELKLGHLNALGISACRWTLCAIDCLLLDTRY